MGYSWLTIIHIYLSGMQCQPVIKICCFIFRWIRQVL